MFGRRTLRLLRRLGSAASLLAAALPALAASRRSDPMGCCSIHRCHRKAIQKQIDAMHATQPHNEFGPQRNALLFLPGSCSVGVPVGFYTEVVGPEAIRSRPHESPFLAFIAIEEALWNRRLDWYGHDSLVI